MSTSPAEIMRWFPPKWAAFVLCWLRGWRFDMDGWLVRARRATDPAALDPEIGFVEDACIAVRDPLAALAVDTGGLVLAARPK